jgi:predicted nucleic acid-binding protein
METIVVDASVALKWFIREGEEHVEEALLILRMHGQGGLKIAVPALFFTECANVLLKAVRRRGLDLKMSLDATEKLLAVDFQECDDHDLLPGAMIFAANHNLTVYDALYAVLAKKLGARLVTEDDKLLTASLGGSVDAMKLEGLKRWLDA